MMERSFYRRDSRKVAKDLLGKKLKKGDLAGKIVETEAYYGKGDPASHAFNGKTQRNKPMFGEPGRIYVYLCYGMYYLLNLTTQERDEPGAVLIRSVEPLRGIKEMKHNRGVNDKYKLTTGPGRLTEAFCITDGNTGEDVVSGESEIEVVDFESPGKIQKSKRIGVSKEHKEDLRFYVAESKFVSNK